MSQRETGETEGGNEEEKDKAMAKGGIKEGCPIGRRSGRYFDPDGRRSGHKFDPNRS